MAPAHLRLARGRAPVNDVDMFLGVDIGTQGVRAVLVTADGEVRARAERALPVPPPGPEQEQSPAGWWDAFVDVVHGLGAARRNVAAMAVSCTSGSVCALDVRGDPVGSGLLYADARALPVDGADPSWAIGKIAWLVAERPDLMARVVLFTSPGGFVTGRLLGAHAPIDVTQALKFGHDPSAGWGSALPVSVDRVPPVVPTGAAIGTIDPAVADHLGLPTSTTVVAGATDGIAGQVACRPSPDRWATAIGSTIVWKAMSAERIDGAGVYSHVGPDGWWFPGAAAHAGARVLSSWATPKELDTLGRSVSVTPDVAPTYPLVGRGERFPFADPDFVPWDEPGASPSERYAAEVLGIALVERWGCDVLVARGCARPRAIASTGGVVSSSSFTQLRCEVLQVPVEVPMEPSSAFGAAVLAAAPALGGLLSAADAMVRIEQRFEPETRHADRWDDVFGRFQLACDRRRRDVA